MNRIRKTFSCCCLLLIGANFPTTYAAGVYDISDEDFARYRAALAQSPSEYTVSVGDSLLAEGKANDDVRLMIAGSTLHEINASARMDSTAIPFIQEVIKYNSLRVEREGWNIHTSYGFFAGYGDLITYQTIAGKYEDAVRTMFEMRSHAIEDPTGFGSALSDQYQATLYNARQDIGLSLKYLESAEQKFNALDLPDNLTFALRMNRYAYLSSTYTYLKDYERGYEYGKKAYEANPSVMGLTMMGNALILMGRREEFKAICDSVATMPTKGRMSGTDSYYKGFLDWYKLLYDKEYDKARELIPTLFSNLNLYSTRMLLEEQAQNWKAAFEASQELRHYSDSIYLAIHDQDLAAIEAHYEAEFKTLEKEKEIMRQRYLLIGSIVALLLLGIILVVVIRHNRIIARKNHALVLNINQLLDSRKQSALSNVPNQISVNEETNESTAHRLVQRYLYELTTRQLYCDPEFNREMLLEELHMPKSTFWKMFEEETGQQFAPYLLNLRLEHAAEVIRNHPEWTIDAIASESGFAGRSTFYKNFTIRFGISPAVYRNEVEKV